MASIRYFKFNEFESPDIKGSGINMDVGFLQMLDNARHIAQIPFEINSGYRSEKHNKKVGGKKSSSHLSRFACDISCKDSATRSKIVVSLAKAGFNRIGIAESFIHVDNDPNKKSAIWLY